MGGEGDKRARNHSNMPEPEVEVQRLDLDEEIRVAIVGAGGYGRVALDVLLAGGMGDRVLGFYDDAHAALSGKVRGYPVLGDVEMLKSMLSVEPVHVVVAITDNEARLRVANSLRALGGQFFTAVHPLAYLSGVGLGWGRLRGRRLGLSCTRMRRWGATVSGAGGGCGQGRGGGGGDLDLRRVRSWGRGPHRGEGRPRPELQRRAQGLVSGDAEVGALRHVTREGA